MAPDGGMGAVAPSSGSVSPPSEKNIMPVGEFLTKNCVLMLRKIPAILFYSPLVGETKPPVGQILAPPLVGGRPPTI